MRYSRRQREKGQGYYCIIRGKKLGPFSTKAQAKRVYLRVMTPKDMKPRRSTFYWFLLFKICDALRMKKLSGKIAVLWADSIDIDQ